MKQTLRIVFNACGSAYYRFRAWGPAWRFLNRKGRTLWQRDARKLSAREETIARELSRIGIASAHISELMPPKVFFELSQFAIHRWESPHVQHEVALHGEILSGAKEKGGTKKAFLVNLWEGQNEEVDAAKPLLDLTHPFIRFSLSEPLLRIVNAYLEMFSKFRAWRLEATIPMPEGIRAASSQRWHRDGEDIKLVKVFLYLNDVPATSGPFMYVRNSHFGGTWRSLFRPTPPSGSPKMPLDEDRFIPKENVAIMSGKAGTIIFCDTSGLHKGGFAETGERLMYTSVYTSAASPQPIRYRYAENFSSQGLGPQALFAVNNNPHQREPKYYF